MAYNFVTKKPTLAAIISGESGAERITPVFSVGREF
jgi:hypothetical protein